ncbi:MAG TPA: asparagine synthase (glutamine-hydrolyzing) [Dongiaceae bacterium]|nr:asparagine synthase (glutamine-hydrolyzing) [Dongiaceae bacterium]
MCGIAGYLRDPDRPAVADEAVLRGMLAAIAHRGPDETGIHVAGPLAFGHLRLAIIDLSGGHQPRVDPVTGDALLYNGEIYGFGALAAELTAAGVNLIDRSDTEVLFRLLQREGVAATLEKIDGMFTFAFYEAKTQSLHLARDRFGEKPIYFAEPGGGFIFGSEPRAVLAHPACRDLPVDPGAVASFLAFEYLPGQRGLRQGMRKLPAGHVLTHARGRTEIRCYWRPDPDEAGSARARESEGERLERLEALLDSGVRDRLVADVPVGVFLSGGIDSSLIAAFVARHAPGLTALTVAVPGASYDETPAARALAKSLGLTHEVVALDEAALLDAFRAVTAHMDEPLADSSLLPTWVLSRAARRHVTVALGGDGADELFAGYISFKANRAAAALAAIPAGLGRLGRQMLAAIPHGGGYMSNGFLLRQLSLASGLDPARQWAACMAPFAPEELDRLWRPEARAAAAASLEDPIAERLQARGAKPWSTAELIHLFATTYLPEDILQKVDRASMYVSLEVRAPYLGRAFAEYAMSLPSDDKLRGLATKRLLKKLALRHLPREIVERKKHGFAVPLARMLRETLKEPVGEAILGRSSPLGDWFRQGHVERLWSEHQSGTRDHRKKLWTLFCLSTAVSNTASAQMH